MTQQSSSGAFAFRSVRRDSAPRSSVRRRWVACALALVPAVFGAVASCGSTQHNSSSSADLRPSVVTMEVRGPVTFVGRAGAVEQLVDEQLAGAIDDRLSAQEGLRLTGHRGSWDRE